MFPRRFSHIRGRYSTAGALAGALNLLFIPVLLTILLGTGILEPVQAKRGLTHSDVSPPYVPQAKTWDALANQGLDKGQVFAIAVSGSSLYIGGDFSHTGDGTLSFLGHIARYDTSDNTWHALPNQGLNGVVYSLVVSGSDLYVGGDFTQSGDGMVKNLNNIARYDIWTKTWQALPNLGLYSDTSNSAVHALALSGNDLYAGGIFTRIGDWSLADLGNIVRYNTMTKTWHALANQGLNNQVHALAVLESDLYVGGDFTETGDGMLSNLGYIVRYDGAWNALPNQGLYSNTANGVRALAVSNGNLHVGGDFTQTGDGALTNLGRIASYDTLSKSWHRLPNQGLSDTVFSLEVNDGDLFIGGGFTQTDDGALTQLGHIIRYDTLSDTFHVLPNQGLTAEGASNCKVGSFAADGDDLYVGGDCTATTGDLTVTALNGIVRYGPIIRGVWTHRVSALGSQLYLVDVVWPYTL